MLTIVIAYSLNRMIFAFFVELKKAKIKLNDGLCTIKLKIRPSNKYRLRTSELKS